MSIDGKDRVTHDAFRGVEGSFDAVMNSAKILSETGLPFQINTTVTRLNADDLESVYALVRSIGAVAWHIFLLVPVGRGEGLKGEELSAKMYEDVLEWLYTMEKKNEIEMKVTCAPHYYRIVKEKGDAPKSAGCLAGKSFLFISHKGIAQPCGYLEVPSGDVKVACKRSGKNHRSSGTSATLHPIKANAAVANSSEFVAVAGHGPTN